jgi:hypothetical protein
VGVGKFIADKGDQNGRNIKTGLADLDWLNMPYRLIPSISRTYRYVQYCSYTDLGCPVTEISSF